MLLTERNPLLMLNSTNILLLSEKEIIRLLFGAKNFLPLLVQVKKAASLGSLFRCWFSSISTS